MTVGSTKFVNKEWVAGTVTNASGDLWLAVAEPRTSTRGGAHVGGGRSRSSSLRRPSHALSPSHCPVTASPRSPRVINGAIGDATSNPGSGATAGTGSAGSGPGGAAGSAGAGAAPGLTLDGAPIYSRYVRLTHEQWENSVHDLLQLPALPGLSTTFTSDPPGSTSRTTRARCS